MIQGIKYIDRVYGNFKITEPIILEIIKSSALQRLKEIDQAGYFEPHFPGTTHSRFEHSLGVYLLLRKYNAPLEEQIAGLIHDVSHSVFSHCIDYVLESGSEKNHSHQDNIFNDYIKKSKIRDILKKYNLKIENILNDKRHPLKEKKLPDLCADRIDYSLRTARVFKEIDNANYFLDHLIAEKYAKLFLKLNTLYYAGLPSALMFCAVGNYLKYALSKKYILENDLYITDKLVLLKIRPYHKKDNHLNMLFARMNNKIGFKNNPYDFDYKIFCKSRIVDPLCMDHGKIKRVSQIDADWNIILKKESKPKQYFIKFNQ